MPIWDKDCSSSECEQVNQTYIHELSLILGDVTPALLAPCDAWSQECADLLGPVVKRLESQATVLGRRVKVTAKQLDDLGVPDLPAGDQADADTAPLIALETGGGNIDRSPVMLVQEGPGDGAVTGRGPTPVEPDHVFGWHFAEVRPAWHAQAVAWAGDTMPDLRAYDSFRDFLAVRMEGEVPDPPPDLDSPDIY